MFDDNPNPVSSSVSSFERWEMGEIIDLAPIPEDISESDQKDELEEANREPTDYEKGFEEGRAEGLESGQAEGFDAGYLAGKEEGVKAAFAEFEEEKAILLKESLASMGKIIASFNTSLDRNCSEEVVEALTSLALKTGEKLARRTVSQDPSIICDIVRELIHEDPILTGRPRLRMNPADAEIVTQELGAELESYGWTIIPDEEITAGGCSAISTEGGLDATWETRWSMISSKYLNDEGS